MDLSAFKAYDIRGRIPDQLNVELAEQIGLAYAAWLKPSNVIVGHDIRLTSPQLTEALISGLRKAGLIATLSGSAARRRCTSRLIFTRWTAGSW